MIVSYLCLVFFVKASDDPQRQLKKPWELIPIIEGLAPGTTYDPTYIDDVIDEDSSTVDMFIYQPGNSVQWASEIRGTSANLKPSLIPNSLWAIAKMSYFDEDQYPDILIITPDLKSVKFFKNKVRENLELVKKEQFNPELAEIVAKLEDWPKFDIYSAGKGVIIIDFMVEDINHDGISDLVLAIRHSDGTSSILEFLFLSATNLEYKLQEIVFENKGISKLLGILKTQNNRNSILYLSQAGHLASIVNKDPYYINQNLVYLNQSESLNFFIKADLDKNQLQDFIIGHSGLAIWACQGKEEWTSKLIVDDGVLSAVKGLSSDILFLYKHKILWGFQVQSKPRNDEFSWEMNGDTFVFHYREVQFEQQNSWNYLKITDFKKSGDVDLLLFSDEIGKIFWGRKKPSNIQGLGWGPEFWIYIMIYVMFMSLGAGIFHSHWSQKIEEQNNTYKGQLGSQAQEFQINSNKNKPNMRKTTV